MRHAGDPVSRREFVHLGAAGAACLGTPGLPWPSWLSDAGPAANPIRVASAAVRWIRSYEIAAPGGVTWPRVPGVDRGGDLSLYHGAPGVVLFLLEHHHQTGGRRALESGLAGARELARRLDTREPIPPGLYTGLAGIAYTLRVAADVSGDLNLASAAQRAVGRIIATARETDAGVTWYDDDPSTASTDIVSGAAGIGFTLLWFGRTRGDEFAIETAIAAARHLETLGQPAEGGRKWPMTPSFARLMPNFSHGTAGVAAFLARAAVSADDDRLLGAAIDGARYLEAVAVCEGDGCRVFHHEPEGEDLFYLSWCHGPAGTARLFYQLGEATGDGSWKDWLPRGAAAIRDLGVPDRRSPGFWNNISQCCGDSGVGEFYLALHALTGQNRYLEYAREIANYVESKADALSDGSMKWTQAEHRVRPELLEAQTGWMQGAAGMGAFFLHLDAREHGRSPLVALPDATWATEL